MALDTAKRLNRIATTDFMVIYFLVVRKTDRCSIGHGAPAKPKDFFFQCGASKPAGERKRETVLVVLASTWGKDLSVNSCKIR